MSTATLDAPAQADATVNPPDTFVSDSIARAVKLAVRAERGRTRSNLGIAEEMVRSIEHAETTVCRSAEDVAEWRENTIDQFAHPISRATGLTLTTRRLAEFLKVHYLVESLPADVRPVADRVNWESFRVLARWVTHQPGETLWEVGETYAEQWNVSTGCEAKLAELVKSLASKPKTRTDLVKILDAHEKSIRGETTTPDSDLGRFGAISEFLASIEARAGKLKLSKAELSDWLIRSGLVNVAAGPVNPASMTADQASSLAAGLMANNNAVAMKALIGRLSAFLANADADSKPAGPATVTLNATPTPNPDPLANSQTRKVA